MTNNITRKEFTKYVLASMATVLFIASGAQQKENIDMQIKVTAKGEQR